MANKETIMGFSSFMCSKTKQSIPAYPWAELPKAASHIVAVLPDDTTIEGIYDGYGRTAPEGVDPASHGDEGKDNIYERYDWDFNAIKVVRFDAYNGEKYDDLEPSDSCPEQGYFLSHETRTNIINSLKGE